MNWPTRSRVPALLGCRVPVPCLPPAAALPPLPRRLPSAAPRLKPQPTAACPRPSPSAPPPGRGRVEPAGRGHAGAAVPPGGHRPPVRRHWRVLGAAHAGGAPPASPQRAGCRGGCGARAFEAALAASLPACGGGRRRRRRRGSRACAVRAPRLAPPQPCHLPAPAPTAAPIRSCRSSWALTAARPSAWWRSWSRAASRRRWCRWVLGAGRRASGCAGCRGSRPSPPCPAVARRARLIRRSPSHRTRPPAGGGAPARQAGGRHGARAQQPRVLRGGAAQRQAAGVEAARGAGRPLLRLLLQGGCRLTCWLEVLLPAVGAAACCGCWGKQLADLFSAYCSKMGAG